MSQIIVVPDYINYMFPEKSLGLEIILLLSIGVVMILYFYSDIISRVYYYYGIKMNFFSPAMTVNDLDRVLEEERLLTRYAKAQEYYSLVCGSYSVSGTSLTDVLLIKDLKSNVLSPGLTLSGEIIRNCEAYLRS